MIFNIKKPGLLAIAGILILTSTNVVSSELCQNLSAPYLNILQAPDDYLLNTEPTNIMGSSSGGPAGQIHLLLKNLTQGGGSSGYITVYGGNFVYQFANDQTLSTEGDWQATVEYTDTNGVLLDAYCKLFNVQKLPTTSSINVSGTLENGSIVTFTGVGTISPFSIRGEDGLQPVYRWQLENGSIVNGKTITRVFAEPGTYAIKMKVYDGKYWSSWRTKNVTIAASATVLSKVTNITVTEVACVAGAAEFKIAWDPGAGSPTVYSYRHENTSTWTTTTNRYFLWDPPPGFSLKWYIRAGNGSQWSASAWVMTTGASCGEGGGGYPKPW